MADAPRDFRSIQNWMQSVIMHPGGVAAGAESAAAREHLEVDPDRIEDVIEPSQALSGADRLAIYSRAYFARLTECLRAEFPMLLRAIGEELFDEFALDYLQQCPSRSYTLALLGANFAQFLKDTQAAAEADRPGELAWLDFLVDLAALEWNFSEVFDGPGVENQTLLAAERLQAIAPEQWLDAKLECVPCLRLIALRFPVQDYYRALRDDPDAAPPEPAETLLAITRRNFVVRHLPLSRPEFELLGALLEGQTVGQAIEHASAFTDGDILQLAANLQSWFQLWTAEGFFLDVEVAKRDWITDNTDGHG